MKPKFYDVMRSKENKIIFGTLAGQAYHLGVEPRLYRFTMVLALLMTMFLVHWAVLLGFILAYLGMSLCTPHYDPMYDSTSPDFDKSTIGTYW